MRLKHSFWCGSCLYGVWLLVCLTWLSLAFGCFLECDLFFEGAFAFELVWLKEREKGRRKREGRGRGRGVAFLNVSKMSGFVYLLKYGVNTVEEREKGERRKGENKVKFG